MIIILGCSNQTDPKKKLYNEETLTQDLLLFSEKERGLIGNFVLRQSFINEFSKNKILGNMVDTSKIVNLSLETYGEIIRLQTEFEDEESRIDSLNKVEEEKRLLEEEKRRKQLLEKQKKFSQLIELTVLSIEDDISEYSFYQTTTLTIVMKSLKGKKINSLEFTLKVFDKNNKLLGEGKLNSSGTFQDEKVSKWELSSMGFSNDLFNLFYGSSVEDYRYDFKFNSFIYDGELIEF